MACTQERHEAIKADDAAWQALDLVGPMPIPADDDEPAYVLELRNCSCKSTLAKRISVAAASPAG